MIKTLYFLVVVFLIILLTRTTFVQVNKPIQQSEIAGVTAPLQAFTHPDGFDLDSSVIDITDDNFNDSEKKYFSIQPIAFSTSYLIAFPGYDNFSKCKWVAQKNLAFQSPLFMLNRVFRI